MIHVYKTSMHLESQLNSSPCEIRAVSRTRYAWLIGTLRKIDQCPRTISPPPSFNEDTEMEAKSRYYNENITEQGATLAHQYQPPLGDKEIRT